MAGCGTVESKKERQDADGRQMVAALGHRLYAPTLATFVLTLADHDEKRIQGQ